MNENETPIVEEMNNAPEPPAKPVEATPAAPEEAVFEEAPSREAEVVDAAAVEPAPKKPFPIKLVGIVAAVIIVAALVVSLITTIRNNKPMKLITTSLTKSAAALKKNDTYKALDSLLNGGSIGVQADSSKLLSDLPAGLLGGIDPDDLKLIATGNVYMNLEDFFLAASGDIQRNKKELLSGTAVASLEYLAVSSEKILGKTNYGISLKNLYKNVKGSIYDPAKADDYAISEALYKYITSMSDGYKKPAQTILKDFDKFWDGLMDELTVQLTKHGDFSKDKDKIEIGKETVSVKTVSMDLGDEELAKVLSEIAKWLKTDKNFKKLLDDIVKYLPMTAVFHSDPEAFVENIYELIEELVDAEELEERLSGTRISMTFYISKSSKQLIQLDCKVKNSGKTTTYSLSIGPDLSSPSEITLVTKTSNGKKNTFSYQVEENSSSQYTARLTAKSDAITTAKLSISWSKKDGLFTVKESDSGLSLNGTMTKKGKVTTILLKKLDAGILSFSDMGVTITLNTSAKMPSISKYTDLVTMKESALENLSDNINDKLDDLKFELQ